MKNFYREQNVNGNPYVWMYTDDAGDMRMVPCDKQGWIDAKAHPPVVDMDSESALMRVTIEREIALEGEGENGLGYDLFVNEMGSKFWFNYDWRVLGWQPEHEPMGVKS